jgi:hypothetical protein
MACDDQMNQDSWNCTGLRDACVNCKSLEYLDASKLCVTCSSFARAGAAHAPVQVLKKPNPANRFDSDKVPLSIVPPTAIVYAALGLLDGALGRGQANYRIEGLRYSVALDALLRHTEKLVGGEDMDTVSGLNHWCHILAVCCMVVDSLEASVMKDDRAPRSDMAALLGRMEVSVRSLKEKHAGQDPKHFTIENSP